jgi:hypothetical protein
MHVRGAARFHHWPARGPLPSTGICSARQRGAPLATIIINGDLSTSYRIALGIALRQLGTL